MKRAMAVRTYNNEIGPRIELSWATIQLREGCQVMHFDEAIAELSVAIAEVENHTPCRLTRDTARVLCQPWVAFATAVPPFLPGLESRGDVLSMLYLVYATLKR